MGRRMRARDLPEAARAALDRMLREDRWTLTEIREALTAQYGADADIGETSIWRYQQLVKSSIERVRATREAARMLVGELVEDGTDTPRALTELVQSLIHQAALAAHTGETVTPEQAQKLASALKSVTEAYGSVVRTSERIEAAARRKLIEEQQAQLKDMGARGVINAETLKTIRESVYGLTD